MNCCIFVVLAQLYEYEYCFTSLSAQSWQYRDRMKPKVAGLLPSLILNDFKGSL